MIVLMCKLLVIIMLVQVINSYNLPYHEYLLFQAQEYTFRLHENPSYQWTPTLSNFDFMSILQNLTAIKIRGTYNKGGEGYLMNFKLETVKIGREKGAEPANWVEKCSCPNAYVGDYCEECAPGFKHEPANGGPYSACIPCDCNGHAHICDTATGEINFY